MKQLILALLISFSGASHAQSANSYIIKGNKYYTQTQFDLAEGQYKKALSIDQGNTTAQFNLANALQKQKKYDEAVPVLEKLYNAGPETKLRSATAYNQGVAYTKQKELEPSIEAYKKALRLNPNDKDARENLQKALSELKKKQDSRNARIRIRKRAVDRIRIGNFYIRYLSISCFMTYLRFPSVLYG